MSPAPCFAYIDPNAGGMLFQLLAPLFAAIIGCWVHGSAASLFGPGLLAGDLPDMVPKVLAALKS